MSSLKSHIVQTMMSTLSDEEVAFLQKKESIASFFCSWQFVAIVAIIGTAVMVCGQAGQREKNESSATPQGEIHIEEVEHNVTR
jgi:hypothetical protein